MSVDSVSPSRVISELRKANKELIRTKDKLAGVEAAPFSKRKTKNGSPSMTSSDY